MSVRWVRLWLPGDDEMSRQIFGTEPVVIDEAPKGIFREVRLATEAETGLYTRLGLPAASPTQGEAE